MNMPIQYLGIPDIIQGYVYTMARYSWGYSKICIYNSWVFLGLLKDKCKQYLGIPVDTQGYVYTIPRYSLGYSPGRVAQSVGHLTRKSEVLGSIPGLATYFRFSFR